jgi:hypothetical protein
MRALLAFIPLLAVGAAPPAYRYQLDSSHSAIDAKVTGSVSSRNPLPSRG